MGSVSSTSESAMNAPLNMSGPLAMSISSTSSSVPTGMSMSTISEPVVSESAVLSQNAIEGDVPEPTIAEAVAFEMASEDNAAAAVDDIDDDDAEDSIESNDPEDEVADFVDEMPAPVEFVNATTPVVPPAPPAPVYDNVDYDPNCPGLNKNHCKKTGEDNTHKR